METIVIDKDRIKIMMTADDMKKYSLEGGDLGCENAETRKALRKILDEASRKTGFDAEPGRVLVQLYESRAGGCEIFVSRLADTERRDEKDGFYITDGLDAVAMMCKKMKNLGSVWNFDVLYGSGGWALRFNGAEPAFASDYGRRLDENERMMADEFYTRLYGKKDIELLSKL